MKIPVQPHPRDYETRIWYSAEKSDECFIAQVVEWFGIMAHGDTCEEAASQIQLALEGALEVPPNKASNRRRLRSHIPRERRGSMLVHKRRMERLG